MKLLTIVVLYGLDQLTKWLTFRHIEYGDGVSVIPGFFNWVHVHNTGAAFGMGQNNNVFFVILSLFVLGLLVWLWHKKHLRGMLNQWAAILLATGILGNVTDRLLHGFVIDFLDFQIRNWHWPAFNIADSCICVAATFFFLAGWKTPKTTA